MKKEPLRGTGTQGYVETMGLTMCRRYVAFEVDLDESVIFLYPRRQPFATCSKLAAFSGTISDYYTGATYSATYVAVVTCEGLRVPVPLVDVTISRGTLYLFFWCLGFWF